MNFRPLLALLGTAVLVAPAAIATPSLPALTIQQVHAAAEIPMLDAAADEQSIVVSAGVPGAEVSRDSFTITAAPPKPVHYASIVGDGPVMWPFPASMISSPYGYRAAPCSGCSTQHGGVDFDPGAGSAIPSVADGVVTAAGTDGTYGTTVMVRHTINGQVVHTMYAHMVAGSMRVKPGQSVGKGQILGAVGTSGAVSGPNLHFEVRFGGVQVDPTAWLHAHAG